MPAVTTFTKIHHHEAYPFISPARPDLSAAGKNVVVTGGGTGVGRAVAIAFAEAGVRSVCILGRRLDRLKSSAEDVIRAASQDEIRVLCEVVDLTAPEQVTNAMNAFRSSVGPIDIFVSNAGYMPVGSLTNTDAAQITWAFEQNVVGALHALQAFSAVASPSGSILINVSAAVVHLPPFPGVFSYAVTKAANTKMSEYFAAENSHIHVVNMHPGDVKTELGLGTELMLSHESADSPDLPGRFCVWLASPEARFLRNKYVWANWDAEELIARADEIKESDMLTWKVA